MIELKTGVTVLQIDNEGIIVDTNTGQYMAINRAAYEIFSSLAAHEDRTITLNRLAALMTGDPAVIDADLTEFHAQLLDLGLAFGTPQ